MKVLLDEQIDIRMKAALSAFDVFTLHDQGWIGLKNGVLRELIQDNDFQGFITADKNFPFQQNLAKIKFLLILIDTPTLLWAHQSLFVPKLALLLENPPPASIKIAHIALDGVSRGKKKSAIQQLLPADAVLFL